MSKFTTHSIGDPYKVVSTTTSGTPVSTTAVTLLNSVLISANTFSATDIVTIEGGVSKSNALGTMTLYLYWNTSESLSGAIQLGVTAAQGATVRYYLIYRRLNIVNTSSSTLLCPVATAGGNDNNIFAGAISNVSINWSNNGYIILAAAHTNASETVTGQWLRVANY